MKKTPPVNKVIFTLLLLFIVLFFKSSTSIQASPIIEEIELGDCLIVGSETILSSYGIQDDKITIVEQPYDIGIEPQRREFKPDRLTKEQVIDKYIDEVCKLYPTIDPYIVKSMAFYESTYNPEARNGNCKGLLQVNEYWHKDRMERLGVTDLYDPYSNILVGVDFLSELFNNYKDPELVLMIYNMKRATAFRMHRRGIVSNYALNVLKRSEELKRGRWYG